MRHVFILNPAAGKRQPALALIPEIEAACQKAGVEYALRQTTAPGDATRIAAEECAAGDVRLYACGGDGTLLELLEGITPGSDAELAHIPCGSGNDFVRMLGGNEAFLNIRDMIAAPAVPVDGILCEAEGKAPRWALNVAATGMDAAVAYDMARFKRLPGISGPMAYNVALVKVFFSRLGCRLNVQLETEEGPVSLDDRYLFALGANGQYYGGGWHSAPFAQPDDGMLDIVLVKKISHLQVLRLLPRYKNGTYAGMKEFFTCRATAMSVKADRPVPVTLDGECFLTDNFRISIRPGAYRMAMPTSVIVARHAAATV